MALRKLRNNKSSLNGENIMKVSCITITYNDSKHLAKTLNSLAEQDYEEIESIIVDGGSEDDTLEIIKEFKNRFRGEVKWISEKDNGLYNALNKGIRMATGDIIGCCWDCFASTSVISEMVRKIEEDHSDGVHGDLVYCTEDKVKRVWKMGEGTMKQGWMPAHPTLYLKRSVYEKYGLYNESYKSAGDFEFMVRALYSGEVRLSYIPKVLVNMFYGGKSTSGFAAYKRSIKESYWALKENGVSDAALVVFKRIIRTLFQFR